jgi:hypothetical protein
VGSSFPLTHIFEDGFQYSIAAILKIASTAAPSRKAIFGKLHLIYVQFDQKA